MQRKVVLGLTGLITAMGLGCASTSNHGLITRQMANPGDLLTSAHPYEEIGSATGRSCRFFLIALIPWGNSTTGDALEKALAGSGGNALLNASVTTSLYGFFPIYNVLSFTCTTVKGVAVQID